MRRAAARVGDILRWRWYWEGLGWARVVFAAGGLLFVAAAVTTQREWHERVVPPVADSALRRVAAAHSVGADLLPVEALAPAERQTAILTAADGRPLVYERLADAGVARDANRALRRALGRGGEPQAPAQDGFFDVVSGCPAACRPAAIGRHGSVTILLVRARPRDAAGSPEADRALATMRSRYAKHVELNPGFNPAANLLRTGLAVAGGVVLLFAPFAAWQATVARSVPRTPHVHGLERLPTAADLADVCPPASRDRVRGRWFLLAQVGIFAACCVLAALDRRLVLVVLAAPALSRLLARRLRRRKPRAAATDLRVGVVASGALRTQAVALRGASIWLTALTWGVCGFVVYAIATLLGEAAAGSATFADQAARDLLPFAVDLAAAGFVLGATLGGTAAMGRFARRLRVLATDRDQRRRARPVILYLRAFEDDRRVVGTGNFERRPAAEIFSFRARVPFEEVLTERLDAHGRVVTVADPQAPAVLLPLGASRTRLTDHEWRATVSRLMRDCALVVISVGTTRGLLWEVEEATRQGFLDRALLVLPPQPDAHALRAAWEACAQAIVAAGGPELKLPVDPGSVLAARLAATGLQRVAIADRRDEYTYAAAIAACLPLDIPGPFASPPHDRAARPRAAAWTAPGKARNFRPVHTAPFVRCADIPEADETVLPRLLATLAEPLKRHGFLLVGQRADGLRFERRYRPLWALAAAIGLFWLIWPLLALRVSRVAVVDIRVDPLGSRGRLIAAGDAPAPVIALVERMLHQQDWLRRR